MNSQIDLKLSSRILCYNRMLPKCMKVYSVHIKWNNVCSVLCHDDVDM